MREEKELREKDSVINIYNYIIPLSLCRTTKSLSLSEKAGGRAIVRE